MTNLNLLETQHIISVDCEKIMQLKTFIKYNQLEAIVKKIDLEFKDSRKKTICRLICSN